MMSLLPKRRWLRFFVPPLLVAFAIFCMWLGWQATIVRERQRLIAVLNERPHQGFTRYGQLRVSWLRTLLGDQGWYSIELWDPPPDLLTSIDQAFPEAEIYVHTAEEISRYRGRMISID